MQVFLQDTNSFNGTYVNGNRIGAERTTSEPIELHAGDILVRHTIIGLEVEDTEPSIRCWA
jgi:pSer/pThr/pTyr-binding forkhead associated (FHA) protein